MKKLILCFLVLFVYTAKAQNFEGTIKWSMKMDITDPAVKAQMAEAQAKMSDPATQAKMKELQEKMKDPQMKALMESNPQMKAMMEKLQTGNLSSLMPSGMTVRIKNQNVISKVEGGAFPVETLYMKDKDQGYMIDRQAKTYSVMNASGGSNKGSGTPPKVTKTSETARILNYNCTKYIVELNEGGHDMKQFIWTTTDIKDIDLKSMSKQRMGNRGQSIFLEGVDGVPLKVEMSSPQGNVVMEVTEIKKESLPVADFAIPSDFKETQGLFGKF